MIKKDWSKTLFDVGLLDYKNKNNNKQKENTWKALQITRNNTQLPKSKIVSMEKSIRCKEKFKPN